MALRRTDERDEPRRFYRAHAAYVGRSLRYLGVLERDLPDAMQEVFQRFFATRERFDGRSPRGWLYGICLRFSLNYRRLARHRRERLSDELDMRQAATGTEHTLARMDARTRLLAALDTLDDAKRAVFVLRDIEERSMAEVAEIVGCPLKTAYARHAAAKRALREALREEGEQ